MPAWVVVVEHAYRYVMGAADTEQDGVKFNFQLSEVTAHSPILCYFFER